MNFSGILIGVFTFFLIGLFHPIVIYAEYYFGSRCWPVFLLVGILCMILSVRMQEILWSVSLGVLGVSCFWSIKELKEYIRVHQNVEQRDFLFVISER